MTLQIGITGLIGAGKTTVSRMVFEAGYPVLDADAEVHYLYAHDEVLRDGIARTFGREALVPGGVNRAYLAQRVFTDSQELEKLECLVHPTLYRHIATKIMQLRTILRPVPRAIFIDAALLYKWTFFAEQLAQVWVVEAPEELRVQRLIGRGLAEADARNRIATQRDFPDIQARQVVRIVNDGGLDAFRNQVRELLCGLHDC
jgi:dephospho-CoA kinase